MVFRFLSARHCEGFLVVNGQAKFLTLLICDFYKAISSTFLWLLLFSSPSWSRAFVLILLSGKAVLSHSTYEALIFTGFPKAVGIMNRIPLLLIAFAQKQMFCTKKRKFDGFSGPRF